MRRFLIGLGIYLAALWGTVDGFPIGNSLLIDWFSHMEVILFTGGVEHPSLFLILIGIGIGYYCISLSHEAISRAQAHNKLRGEANEITGKHKALFFSSVNRAYGKWRANHSDAPEKLNDLIDHTKKIVWESVRGVEVARIEKALQKANPFLWNFCDQFYRDIEHHKATAQTPKFLPGKDAIDFDTARRALTTFWDDKAYQVYSTRQLRRRKLKAYIEHDRLFMILPYLEVALAKTISPQVRAENLFRIIYETPKRRVMWRAVNISALKKLANRSA